MICMAVSVIFSANTESKHLHLHLYTARTKIQENYVGLYSDFTLYYTIKSKIQVFDPNL